MLEARHFTILTDHKLHAFAFHQKRDKCSPRQFNHLDFISQFTTDIRQTSGQENIVAGTLSRVEAINVPVTQDALAAAQAEDEVLQRPLVSSTALQLKKIPIPVPTSSCTATHLLVNHARTSRLLSAVKYSIPCIPSVTPEPRKRQS
jgi:hypothetical protein